MINIRYCKRCKSAYDIDTSKELCPDCRNNKNVKNNKGVNGDDRL